MKEKKPLNFTSEAAMLKGLIFILNLLRYLLTSPTHLPTRMFNFMPGLWELVFPSVGKLECSCCFVELTLVMAYLR